MYANYTGLGERFDKKKYIVHTVNFTTRVFLCALQLLFSLSFYHSPTAQGNFYASV